MNEVDEITDDPATMMIPTIPSERDPDWITSQPDSTPEDVNTDGLNRTAANPGSASPDDTNPDGANQVWSDLQPSNPYPSIGSDRNTDDDDVTDEGRSQKTFNTLEKIYSGESGDNLSFQSYGYSLDDGIASKQSFTPSSGSGPTLGSGKSKDLDHDSVDISLGSVDDSSVFSGLTNEDGSLLRTGTNRSSKFKTPEDFNDLESVEEDPLDSLVPTSHERVWKSTSVDSIDLEPKLYERVCHAPPGKLGVVIDTTRLGPVIYQVKEGSPLQGLVFPGDRIIAVDDIDTRGMTASNITKIMARKANVERKITVASKKEEFR